MHFLVIKTGLKAIFPNPGLNNREITVGLAFLNLHTKNLNFVYKKQKKTYLFRSDVVLDDSCLIHSRRFTQRQQRINE
jgi:hypothetical protein